jgi:hypothetical protein
MTSLIRALLRPTALLLLLAAPEAWSAIRPEAVVVRSAKSIAALTFLKPRFPIIVRELDDGQMKLLVRLSGRFNGRRSKLLFNNEPVSVDDGQFEIELTLRDATTSLEFSTVSVFGAVQFEEVVLQSDPPNPVREILNGLQAEVSSFNIGLSAASMNYEDSSGEKLSQISLGAKLSYSRFITPNRKHVIAANSYTAFNPISQSRTDTHLWLFGANLRYGYFLGTYKRAKIWLYGGYFFTTTMSPGERIGFTNLLGPQLYPTVSFHLRKRDSIATYFKFAPLYGLQDLASREIAFGVSYTRRSLLGLSNSFSLDYSQITLNPGTARIQLSSTVLGYSVGF